MPDESGRETSQAANEVEVQAAMENVEEGEIVPESGFVLLFRAIFAVKTRIRVSKQQIFQRRSIDSVFFFLHYSI